MGSKLCAAPDDFDHYNIDLSPEWHMDVDLSVNGLSESEITTVTEFWVNLQVQDIRSKHSVFLVSFFRLFVFAPKIQNLFYVSSKLLTLDQWEHYPLFMSHVRRIRTALGMAVSMLNDQYVCFEYLKTVACFHQSAGLRRIYIATWMKIFDDEIDSCFCDLYTGEVKSVFRKFLTIVCEKLSTGLAQ